MNRLIKLLSPILFLSLMTILTNCGNKDAINYVQGGRNIEVDKYGRDESNPTYPQNASFLGYLEGDWFEIGKSYGKKSGESSRYVSDIWWKDMCEMYGKEETLIALDLYREQIEHFDPQLIKFMEGITAGAAEWLSSSQYADKNDSLYATNFQRVLAVNCWDEWAIMHPRTFPDGRSTFGGVIKEPMVLPHQVGCSAFAAFGEATMNGEMISAHNRHAGYNPRCYEQVFIINPKDGHECWVLSNSPQVSANQVVNEYGVSISLLAGGITNPASINHSEGPFYAEDFGVPWFHLFLRVGTQAKTANEAIVLLTKGTQEYRDRTGRNSLLRCGGWIFLVADENTLAVVESTAKRYAVRYAGDELSYTGKEWINKNYIAATNHYICDGSFDENNKETNVPMTIFNEGYIRDKDGEILGLTESGIRFWTLMWDIRHNYGNVDKYRTQQIMSGLYAYDKVTGEKIDVAKDDEDNWHIFGKIKYCTAGRASLYAATCDSKIAINDSSGTSVIWTMGNPIHWQGAWDYFTFK